ncbi:hypothetical protein [uncultured Pontibacter sp.]|uniref:hypothetical protein n=1 Tax=uncultured Pontibacter sp. TaxID=453356 RepID=UPI00261E8727|nr:hypothetical protein [uncultured Pontibacter sp.]
MMKKGLLQLSFVATFYFMLSFTASAQVEMIQDFMGRPIEIKQYVDVKGSPYLTDDWQAGSVKLDNGKIFEGLQLKYDQIEEELMFLNKAEEAQLFVDPIAEFTIIGRTFRRGYTPADGATPKTFYQVLADGETQLLKRTSKKIYEEVPYGTATKIKNIIENETYYLADAEGKLTKIRKDKKAITNALSNKKSELEDYVKANRLDLRQEGDMAKLVTYYNSL